MRLVVGPAIGLVWSNWMEYAYHRWAMHWPSLYEAAAMRHTEHHAVPGDPEYITMSPGLWMLLFGINVLLFAVPDQLLHLRILAGVAVGFLIYLVVGIDIHRRLHDGRWAPQAWKAHHWCRHVRPRNNFNIFLPLFDCLLNTRERVSPLRKCTFM